MQVPLLLRHPARLPAATTMAARVCTYDLYPTLVDYLGLDTPAIPDLPGASYAPALLGHETLPADRAIFHEYHQTRAVQTPDWKLILRHPDGPNELYDLQADPDERRNRIDDPAVAPAQAEMTALLHAHFTRHATPQYDLWHTGTSKSGPHPD